MRAGRASTLPMSMVAAFGRHAFAGLSGLAATAVGLSPATAADANGAPASNAASNAAVTDRLPVISLDMSACPTDELEVRRLLAIELEAKVIGPASRTADMSSVAVTCANDVYEIVVVSRTDPSKKRRRELDLGSTGPKARARFLALAMIELITTRWPDPRPPEIVVAPTPPPQPVASVAAAAPPPQPPSRLRVTAGPVARVFPAAAGALGTWGAAGRIAWSAGRAELASDIVVEAGTSGVALGDVRARAISIGPSIGLRSSAERRFGWRAGAGARVGVATLDGRASDGQRVGSESFSAPWGGPFATAGTTMRVAGGWSVELAGELGWAVVSLVARALDAGGARVEDVSWRGPWAAIGVSLGWAPR